MQTDSTRIECSCRKTAVDLQGPSIFRAACHCDDCQAAAEQLQRDCGVSQVTDNYLGTHYILHRNDRYKIASGSDTLEAHKLRADSPTQRMVAGCCSSPMFMSFSNAQHWIAAYHNRVIGDSPPISSRIMTRFLPDGVDLPKNPPSYKSIPLRMGARLLWSRILMLMQRDG